MLAPLISLMPIYILIALGAVAIRSRLVAPEALPYLSRFVLVICMPVIIATAVARAGDLSGFNWAFIGGYAAVSLVVLFGGAWIMQRFFDLPAPQSMMMGLGMSCSNSIFLGYPVALTLFPEQVDDLFAWILVAENLVVIPLALTFADAQGQGRQGGLAASAKRTLAQMMRNPVLLGLVAGFVLAAFRFEPQGPLEQTRAMIAAAAPLLALFFVGGTVAASGWGEAGRAVLLIAMAKLVAHPALMLGAMWALPGVGPELAKAAMVFAAMPMIAIFPILSSRHGAANLASSALVVTTLAGAVTVGIIATLV